jgi:hypothetical protein
LEKIRAARCGGFFGEQVVAKRSFALDPFLVGDVYFRVTYPDPALKFPRIESFVFVGKNLSDEDTEETWYFQFADSFAKDGSILETAGRARRVSSLTQDELGDMLDDERLLKELGAARRRQLSDPTA